MPHTQHNHILGAPNGQLGDRVIASITHRPTNALYVVFHQTFSKIHYNLIHSTDSSAGNPRESIYFDVCNDFVVPLKEVMIKKLAEYGKIKKAYLETEGASL